MKYLRIDARFTQLKSGGKATKAAPDDDGLAHQGMSGRRSGHGATSRQRQLQIASANVDSLREAQRKHERERERCEKLRLQRVPWRREEEEEGEEVHAELLRAAASKGQGRRQPLEREHSTRRPTRIIVASIPSRRRYPTPTGFLKETLPCPGREESPCRNHPPHFHPSPSTRPMQRRHTKVAFLLYPPYHLLMPLIPSQHLLVLATSEQFLPTGGTFRASLASESHWLQLPLVPRGRGNPLEADCMKFQPFWVGGQPQLHTIMRL